MDKNQPCSYSHLFTVRLWVEEPGNGQTEWRGQVQHVMSGEKRYFRDWSTLIAFLGHRLRPRSQHQRADGQRGCTRSRGRRGPAAI
jgi:hypothetical protein